MARRKPSIGLWHLYLDGRYIPYEFPLSAKISSGIIGSDLHNKLGPTPDTPFKDAYSLKQLFGAVPQKPKTGSTLVWLTPSHLCSATVESA